MFSIRTTSCISCFQCVHACPMGIFHQGADGPEVGREKRCLHCMHCCAACPTQSICVEGVDQAELYPPKSEEPLRALLQSRRSIRHFTSEPPSQALVQSALDGAAWAPNAKNARTYRWIVLYGVDKTRQAAELTIEYARRSRLAPELILSVRAGRNPVTCGAPCVLLACAPEACGSLDCGIAMSYVEMLLVQQGLGTCWGGYLARAASADPALRSFLKLPDGWKVPCTLMIGWPDGEHYPNLPARPGIETAWIL